MDEPHQFRDVDGPIPILIGCMHIAPRLIGSQVNSGASRTDDTFALVNGQVGKSLEERRLLRGDGEGRGGAAWIASLLEDSIIAMTEGGERGVDCFFVPPSLHTAGAV